MANFVYWLFFFSFKSEAEVERFMFAEPLKAEESDNFEISGKVVTADVADEGSVKPETTVSSSSILDQWAF